MIAGQNGSHVMAVGATPTTPQPTSSPTNRKRAHGRSRKMKAFAGERAARSWPWLTLLVPAIAAVGYALAYVRELGFCGEFMIPTNFIVVSWTTTLVTTGTLLLFALLLLPFAWLLHAVLPKYTKLFPGWRRAYVIAYATFLCLVAMLAFRYQALLWPELIGFFFGITIAMLLRFLLPLVTQRGVKGYWEKLNMQGELEDRHDPLLVYVIRYVGPIVFLGIFLIAFVLGFGYLEGKNTARTQTGYLVVSLEQELAVLRVYGDNLICAPLDRENREVERNSFRVLEASGTTLTFGQVGPLSLSPVGPQE